MLISCGFCAWGDGRLYVFRSVCLYVCMSVCLDVCMAVCLHVCMSVCLYVRMSACLHVCMSVCLYVCGLDASCGRCGGRRPPIRRTVVLRSGSSTQRHIKSGSAIEAHMTGSTGPSPCCEAKLQSLSYATSTAVHTDNLM